jgi:hypothetical protein
VPVVDIIAGASLARPTVNLSLSVVKIGGRTGQAAAAIHSGPAPSRYSVLKDLISRSRDYRRDQRFESTSLQRRE